MCVTETQVRAVVYFEGQTIHLVGYQSEAESTARGRYFALHSRFAIDSRYALQTLGCPPGANEPGVRR